MFCFLGVGVGGWWFPGKYLLIALCCSEIRPHWLTWGEHFLQMLESSLFTKHGLYGYIFTSRPRVSTTLKKALENIVGKRENAGDQHFLFFTQYFLSYQRQKSSFKIYLFCRLQIISILASPF